MILYSDVQNDQNQKSRKSEQKSLVGHKRQFYNRQRKPGSLGASSYPSRVFKGKRLPGQTGGERVKVQNLKVLKVIAENNLLLVKGSIPGAKGTYVIIEK